MINILEDNKVFGRDIHQALELKSRYTDWAKAGIKYLDLVNGQDFNEFLHESTGGRPLLDHVFTLDSAKQLCIIDKSQKGKELRKWIISQMDAIEKGQLLTHQQVITIVRMIKVFSVYEYRKKALDYNMANYVDNATANNPSLLRNKKYLYGAFNNWRNEVLQLGKEHLKHRLQEYCLIEKKAYTKKTYSKDQILTILGEYDQIKVAFWDLLSSQGQSEELINSVCALAQDLSKEIKPFLVRLDESDLFHKKLDQNEVARVLNDKKLLNK